MREELGGGGGVEGGNSRERRSGREGVENFGFLPSCDSSPISLVYTQYWGGRVTNSDLVYFYDL